MLKTKGNKVPDRPGGAVERVAEIGIVAPRVGDWLWRPDCARLWWMGAAMFWLLAVMLPTAVLRDISGGWDTLIFAAMMLFHPFVMLPVLGFGFARAWIAFARASRTGEVVGFREPSSDGYTLSSWSNNPWSINPADSRSAFNPLNPLSEAWREEYLWPRR